jgi:hypothetical protein
MLNSRRVLRHCEIVPDVPASCRTNDREAKSIGVAFIEAPVDGIPTRGRR